MEKYLDINNIIAIIKEKRKSIIIFVDNIVVINKNIKKIIDELCILNGSSLEGRIKYAQNVIKKAYKVPIVICDNCVLLQLESWKKDSMICLNACKILNYKVTNNNMLIRCVCNYIFKIDISKSRLERMLINYIKLNNQIKWQENANFV